MHPNITAASAYEQYADVARANIDTLTPDQFAALPADAPIAVGDIVAVHSCDRFRRAVAVKVGPKNVECLASTPSGRGLVMGAKGAKGGNCRLIAQATPATAPEPADVDVTTWIAVKSPTTNPSPDHINVRVVVVASDTFTYRRADYERAVRDGELRDLLADATSNLSEIDGLVVEPDGTEHPFRP
ncbi:hypothetical protein GCM10010124_26430 [Pilimelia terevasa]|uniref:Uncharacterized protein n=1 Tax=Pilimelia terevasa TaxID=53372 RepID=A0A8J3BMJ4_9ACTN|nr:hypothetical protein [Pilimelia terevasa]GGK32365.1 hypothetical protein GCM10010124_26430 [Pilimelia terevasa]